MAIDLRDWEDASDTDGSYAIACAIIALARAIDRLGNADAATPMGAIEGLAEHLGKRIDNLADAVRECAPE